LANRGLAFAMLASSSGAYARRCLHQRSAQFRQFFDGFYFLRLSTIARFTQLF
jgi:hypothetical protein